MTARTQTKVEISLKSINFVFEGGSNRKEISQQCGNKTHIVKKRSRMSRAGTETFPNYSL